MTKSPEDILSVLEKMREHELAMAEFYRTCSQVWLVDKEFWTDMKQAEMRHAKHLEKMVKFLSERPESFN